YFGWIPASEMPPPPERVAARPAQPVVLDLQADNGPAPLVALVWRTVPAGHPDEPALEVLGSILGGDESSRLHRRLVVDESVAMLALSGAFSLQLDGVFGAGAVLSPIGGDVEAVRTALLEEVDQLRTEGPTEAEVDKARTNALRGAVTSQLTADSKASLRGRAAVIYGDSERANSYFEDIESVTREDVLRVAQT